MITVNIVDRVPREVRSGLLQRLMRKKSFQINWSGYMTVVFCIQDWI
jgi:hypothetical protein